jgi:dienelactone hydrolase
MMARWNGALGLLLWLAGTAASLIATFAGVTTTAVQLRLDDGTPIRGTLYQSSKIQSPTPGVVVLHGAAVSHCSCAPGLSAPLARKGYTVLAIDLIGHGNSGGSRPRSEYGRLEEILSTHATHPEVEAAIEFLQQQPGVDPTKIALVGHSRGGWAAANVARRRADIASIVTIGIAPSGCDALRPRNLFVLTGDHDSFAPADMAEAAIANATGGAVRDSHHATGDFVAGTARKWVMLPGAYHLSALADPAVTRYSSSWLGFSFGKHSGSTSGTRLLIAIFGSLAATLGGVLTCRWILTLLPPLPSFFLSALRRGGRGGLQPALESQYVSECLDTALYPPYPPFVRGGGRSAPRLRFAVPPILLTISLLSAAPLAAWLSHGVELGPLQFALPAVVLAACTGVISFLLARSLIRSCSPHPQGVRGVKDEGCELITTARALPLGLFALGLSLAMLGVTWGIAWADLWPTPERLGWCFVLLLAILPCSWLLARGVDRVTGGPETTLRQVVRGGVWLLTGVAVWLGFELFVLDHWPLFTVPVWLLSVSLFVPLPLWLLPNRAGMTLARTLCHAAGAAWLLACHLPFTHPG